MNIAGLYTNGLWNFHDPKDLKIIAFMLGPFVILFSSGMIGLATGKRHNLSLWLAFLLVILILNVVTIGMMIQSPYNQWGTGSIPWAALTTVEYFLFGGVMIYMISKLIRSKRGP